MWVGVARIPLMASATSLVAWIFSCSSYSLRNFGLCRERLMVSTTSGSRAYIHTLERYGFRAATLAIAVPNAPAPSTQTL